MVAQGRINVSRHLHKSVDVEGSKNLHESISLDQVLMTQPEASPDARMYLLTVDKCEMFSIRYVLPWELI